MLRTELRVEDGEIVWKSEREERKEETSGESETVRLAIINHIRCWRRPRILATRQTLHLSSVSCLSSAYSLVTLITHTALCHAPKTHDWGWIVLTATNERSTLVLVLTDQIQEELNLQPYTMNMPYNQRIKKHDDSNSITCSQTPSHAPRQLHKLTIKIIRGINILVGHN